MSSLIDLGLTYKTITGHCRSMNPRSLYDLDHPVIIFTLLGLAIGLFVWISLHLL
jgi:hypothetical protein